MMKNINSALETTHNQLQKRIKPVTKSIPGGEYNPLLLPGLQGFENTDISLHGFIDCRTFSSFTLSTGLINSSYEQINYLDRHIKVQKIVPPDAVKGAALVYFHGGSFYGGSTENVQDMLKLVAEKSQVTVFNVDYSLAPKNPFPEGILDGSAVCLHLQKKLSYQKIFLSGDSAGGNIALGVYNHLHELGHEIISGNILLYPIVTLADDNTKELWDLAAYPIKSDQLKIRDNYCHYYQDLTHIMRNYYLKNDENPKSSLISPLYGGHKLPDTLLIVGEYDFFRLQDEAFAEKIQSLGTNVNFIQYNGMAHAFAHLTGVYDQAADAVMEIADFIENSLKN